MITLIHGDDKKNVYEKFTQVLESKITRIDIDLGKQSLEQALDAAASNSLFSTKRNIVVRNLKSLHHTKRKKLFEAFSNYKKDPDTHILILEEKLLDKKITSKIPHDRNYEFQLPKYFFEFLDNLTPKKGGQVSRLINTLSRSTQGEQLFYATVNRVRALLLFKAPDSQKFSDTKKMAPFFQSKIRSQAQKWDLEKLKDFYKSLYELEIGLKSSNLPMDITQHLDITVKKHLQ